MRRRIGLIIWFVVVAAVAALFLAWQYVDYQAASRTLPAGMTMAGLAVEGMTRQEALDELKRAFSTRVEVIYQGQRLTLAPDSVEFRFDAEKTAANLDAALAQRQGLDGFIAHALGHTPPPVDVPVVVTYSEERLDGFLARVAKQNDQPPRPPVPLLPSLTFSAGQPGYQLDLEASRVRLAAALVSAAQRRVDLVVRTEQAPPLEIDMLHQMLQSLANDHPDVVAGIFFKNLQTGDEVAINADVAYSGLSVLKIAVLEETYRALDMPIDLEVTDWISDATGITSSNFKANLLLRDVVGDGDGDQGAENLTASMGRLGLVNTFMIAPYDASCPTSIPTPANSRSDIDTHPDACMQTTPAEVGLLLEMIYQCSQGGGALLVVYPDRFSPDECREMIAWMTNNRFDQLIEKGLPEGTVVAQKHGFNDGGPHADAGIVFSPGGDFVLVVYLDSPQYLEWSESSAMIADIARATYNYLNPMR